MTIDCRLGEPLPHLFYQLPNQYSKDLKVETFFLNFKTKIIYNKIYIK